MLLTGDFETTTDLNDCRVWAWGLCSIEDPSFFEYGNDIDSFMKKCSVSNENHTIYFHNLKFDGEFIMYWLFRNGFKYVENRKLFKNKTFTTLISDKGQFYSLEVCFKKRGKKINKVLFIDSLKLLNFSVEKIAKDFNLPIRKGSIDYTAFREIGHELTLEEIAYLRNDVEIMARALNEMFSKGLTKMTIGSNALEEYKCVIGKKTFTKTYPIPKYDADIRRSYKGGFTYLNEKFANRIIPRGRGTRR